MKSKQLAAYIAEHTKYSRRQAVELIKSSQVTVNSNVGEIGQKVTQADQIEIDKEPIILQKLTYVKLHKPIGYVCSKKSQNNHQTIYDLIPNELHHLAYAGRLDADSSGLVLLSNDGDWVYRLTHPKFEIPRTYLIELSTKINNLDLAALKKGVRLTDGLSKFTEIKVSEKELEVTLSEGRNRQIRRTFGEFGYEVIKLHRLSHGVNELGDLREGDFIRIRKT